MGSAAGVVDGSTTSGREWALEFWGEGERRPPDFFRLRGVRAPPVRSVKDLFEFVRERVTSALEELTDSSSIVSIRSVSLPSFLVLVTCRWATSID